MSQLISELQAYIDGMPFAKGFRFRVEEARRGFVRVALKPAENFFNHFGTYQAGVICTLAEITGGSLCGTFHELTQNFLITKLTQVKFERATHDTLVAEASLEERAIQERLSNLQNQRKTDVEVSVQIKTPAGEQIATSLGLYYLRVGFPSRFESKSRK